jgi:hypothetical protein
MEEGPPFVHYGLFRRDMLRARGSRLDIFLKGLISEPKQDSPHRVFHSPNMVLRQDPPHRMFHSPKMMLRQDPPHRVFHSPNMVLRLYPG